MVAQEVKNPPAKSGAAGDADSNPWVGKIPWRKKWQPLRYSCLGNFMNRGASWVTVHGSQESDTTKGLKPLPPNHRMHNTNSEP